jgi:Carboxypeptidase regulatory-like domain
MRFRMALALAIIMGGIGPVAAAAQGPLPAVVHVRVTDAAQAPLAGVTLVVIRAHEEGSLIGTTANDGRHTFVFGPDSGSYRVVAKKISYVQTTRLLPAHAGDTINITLSLARIPPQLDTVRVSAHALSDDYAINARMISTVGERRYVKDAYDALRDINPNMLGDDARECRPVRNIWVNGRREEFSPTPGYDMPTGQSPGADATVPIDAWSGPPPVGRRGRRGANSASSAHAPHAAPTDLLGMIKSEHIAMILYHNCWDTSYPGSGTRNAIFITLKDGYAFDPKRGSYPIDSTPPR